MKKIVLLLLIFSSVVFADEIPKESIYQIQSAWTDENGKSMSLKSFAGKPTIIAMTYTGCQYSCPMTFKKLKQIEKDLQAQGVKNFQFVIASFDPIKDKPKVTKAFLLKEKLNLDSWTFLSAKSDSDVRQLAVILGINYQKISDGDFSHSNEISLLDSQGVIAVKLKGVNAEHEDLVEKLKMYEAKSNK